MRSKIAGAMGLRTGWAAAAILLTVAAGAAFLFSTAGIARATLRLISLEEMTRKSEHIVCGEVIDMQCYRGPFLNLGEIIFTDVTVKVTEKLAGGPDGDTITIQVPGGKIGEQVLICPDAPPYAKGEKVILFLRRYNGRIWNTGWAQGKYALQEPAEGSGEPVRVEGIPTFPIPATRSLPDLRAEVLRLKREEGR